jgi:hypothetical protein
MIELTLRVMFGIIVGICVCVAWLVIGKVLESTGFIIPASQSLVDYLYAVVLFVVFGVILSSMSWVWARKTLLPHVVNRSVADYILFLFGLFGLGIGVFLFFLLSNLFK